MIRLIILCIALFCLSGCLTPHAFRNEHSQKTGRYTTYDVTDYNDGFKVDMKYTKLEPGGTATETKFIARNKLKNLAIWIAEARKRKLKPINIEDIESFHYHNSATRYTHWRGEIRVYYDE